MKSLNAQHHYLSDEHVQVDIIEHGVNRLIPFQEKLMESSLYPLQPTKLEIFQVNLGKMCNQTCRHCHVDAGPDRKEIMTRETMEQCLAVLRINPSLRVVDMTGGAPELNPGFREFAASVRSLGRHVIVRCNLTIIVSNRKFYDLPEFFRDNQIEVISSLPFYSKERTDRQRGEGVFESSLRALKMLNEVGYGDETSGLLLNLVYNPAGAFLPPEQSSLERQFKKELMNKHGIKFNNLYTITNMPISRYLDYLLESGNYEDYMIRLTEAYNPAAAANVMCRNTISVGWNGFLYDCDFNQMLGLKVNASSTHISDFNSDELNGRKIVIGQHCFGCTAGSGSSCGGAVV